jgi:hypothetical protein
MSRTTAAMLAASSIALAQTTHVVGPGGFADINQALAVATHGDVVLVHPGTYAPFLTTLGVTIRALSPGSVTLAAGLGSGFFLQPGRQAHVVGVSGNWMFVVGGTLMLDQCTFQGVPNSAVVEVSGGTLHLQSCTVRGLPMTGVAPGAALRASGSVVIGVDCTIDGSDGSLFFGTPGPAIGLQGSELRLASSTVRGGNRGWHPPAVAIVADAASFVWLADCVLASPAAPCPVSASNGRLARCTSTPNCGSLPSGDGLGLLRVAPLQNGALFPLEFRDAPNRVVGVWAGFDLQPTTVPLFEQSVLLAPASAFPLAVLVTDATGLATAAWPIPAGSGFVDRTLWFQAVGGLAAPLQTSVVAGGVVR